jgi:hypothetical protein
LNFAIPKREDEEVQSMNIYASPDLNKKAKKREEE